MPKLSDKRPASIQTVHEGEKNANRNQSDPPSPVGERFSSLRSSPLTSAQKNQLNAAPPQEACQRETDDKMYSMASTSSALPPPLPQTSISTAAVLPTTCSTPAREREFTTEGPTKTVAQSKSATRQSITMKTGLNTVLKDQQKQQARLASQTSGPCRPIASCVVEKPKPIANSSLHSYVSQIRPRQRVVYDAYGNEIGYNKGLPHERNPIIAAAMERYINLSIYFGVEKPTTEDFEFRVTGITTQRANPPCLSHGRKGDKGDDLAVPLASTVASATFGPTVTSIGNCGILDTDESLEEDDLVISHSVGSNKQSSNDSQLSLSRAKSASLIFGLTSQKTDFSSADGSVGDKTAGNYVSLGLSRSAPTFGVQHCNKNKTEEKENPTKIFRSHTFSEFGAPRIPQIADAGVASKNAAEGTKPIQETSWYLKFFGDNSRHSTRMSRRQVEKKSRLGRFF